MKLTPVKSSNINAIGHDKSSSELHVEFKNGKTFIYKDVSQTDALKLFQAESVGKHFNQFIKAVKVGSEVIAVAEPCKPPMSDKEKIKLLREALESISDWDMNDASNRIIDITEKALVATKD